MLISVMSMEHGLHGLDTDLKGFSERDVDGTRITQIRHGFTRIFSERDVD